MKYDLVICAPPYIPHPFIKEDIFVFSQFAGTHLLEVSISKVKEYAKELMVIHSNLADQEVEGRIGRDMSYEVLTTKECPFRVPAVLMNDYWLKYLLNERGLKISDDQKYKYWHTIKVVRIS
jgi:hypothetical protein